MFHMKIAHVSCPVDIEAQECKASKIKVFLWILLIWNL